MMGASAWAAQALKEGQDMAQARRHSETHLVNRAGWLRAAVLGANDGLLSTSSLIVGVAAASAGRGSILLTGVAGLVAGAMSMAAGEYVSVSSQADSEAADLAREKRELAANPDSEQRELSAIYVERGVEPDLARKVARPIQAAMASAASFAIGAGLPLAVALVVPRTLLSSAVAIASLLFLGVLGAMGARAGRAKIFRGTVRAMFWGTLAMLTTGGVGALFGTHVGG
jgi:VIT1/CCC1 family predicted Fe2+/Mn2+ transporter